MPLTLTVLLYTSVVPLELPLPEPLPDPLPLPLPELPGVGAGVSSPLTLGAASTCTRHVINTSLSIAALAVTIASSTLASASTVTSPLLST